MEWLIQSWIECVVAMVGKEALGLIILVGIVVPVATITTSLFAMAWLFYIIGWIPRQAHTGLMFSAKLSVLTAIILVPTLTWATNSVAKEEIHRELAQGRKEMIFWIVLSVFVVVAISWGIYRYENWKIKNF